MDIVQNVGDLERQFQEIVKNALDKRAYLTIITNAVADTEDAFTHGLGYIPNGYIVISRDKAAVIYNGGTANTDNLIHLRANVVTVAISVMVF